MMSIDDFFDPFFVGYKYKKSKGCVFVTYLNEFGSKYSRFHFIFF